MKRLVQILERCVARLDQIIVNDPLRPGTKYIHTSQLPERLEAIRGDLKDVIGFLEKRRKARSD